MREIVNEMGIYEPTEAEKKVLYVAINPDYFGMSIVDKCKVADVTRTTWYNCINKKEFVELMNKMIIDTLKSNIGDIVQATIKFGKTSSKNSADRKMLLTMAGLYTDKLDANVNEDVSIKVTKPDFNKPKEEIE